MRRILAGLVLILMLTGGAAAGPLRDGAIAYQSGDYATALRHWRPLARQGNADAQFQLGSLYSSGLGVPQDYVEAAKWYRLAAEQGEADGHFGLGLLYLKGFGVPKDFVLAHMRFNLAASQYPGTQAKKRDEAVKLRDAIASKMTPEQIAEAQKLAREWKPK